MNEMNKIFPTLFKLTSTNATQYWKISVEEFICNYGKIITEYGQVGTDKPQITYYYRLSNTALQLLKGKRNRMKITQKDMEHKLKLKRDYYWR